MGFPLEEGDHLEALIRALATASSVDDVRRILARHDVDEADGPPLPEQPERRALIATARALKQTETDLQQAIRLRDEFLSIASHELNTPLTALQLNLQALHRKLTKAAETDGFDIQQLRRNSSQMVAQVERLARLLGNLLDVSRIRNRRLHLDFEVFDLCQTVRDVIYRMAALASEKGVELRLVDCDPVVGYWDRLRMEQVVANLLSNAIKYGDAKPVEVRVAAQGETAILEVRDQGIGIAMADLPRIFERFERATGVQRTQSFGLGLFITREIIKAHGGRITVESAPGQGTCFQVTLPIHGMSQVHLETEEVPPTGTEPSGARKD